MKKRLVTLSALALAASLLAPSAMASDPPVKKSENNICHKKGGRYYSKTKNFTPYNSMEACIKSGGRASKR